MRWLDPRSSCRNPGQGPCDRGGRGRGRCEKGIKRIGNSTKPRFKLENVGRYEKSTRYSRRGGRAGRAPGQGQTQRRRSIRHHRKSEGRAVLGKEVQWGSFTNIGIGMKPNSFDESPTTTAGNKWGLETTTDYIKDEGTSSGSESDENNSVSGDKYDNPATNCSIDYVQDNCMDFVEDEMKEDDDDDDDDDIDGYRV